MGAGELNVTISRLADYRRARLTNRIGDHRDLTDISSDHCHTTHENHPLYSRFRTQVHIRHALHAFDDDRQARVFLPLISPSISKERRAYPDKTDIIPSEIGILIPRDRLTDSQWRLGRTPRTIFDRCLASFS